MRNGTLIDPTLIAQEYIIRLLETTQSDPRAAYIAASARAEGDKTLAAIRPAAQKVYPRAQASHPRATGRDGPDESRRRQPARRHRQSFLHPPGFALHDELETLVDSGVSTADALRAATVNPARTVPRLQTGHIAPGKRADLVLLDANPLEDIRDVRRIKAVVARGRYFDRASLDRLLRQATALAGRS